MDHLKLWLDRNEPPENYYQLLGEPCLSADRETLLKAVRTATKFLHLYQNHKNQGIVQRARRLQLLCARAEHTFLKDDLWVSYDNQLLQSFRDEFSQEASTTGFDSSTGNVRTWLQANCHVATDRLDEVEAFVTQRDLRDPKDSKDLRELKGSNLSNATSSELPSTHSALNDVQIEETQEFHAHSRPDLNRIVADNVSSADLRNLPFKVGNYEVLERLGEGGVGIVYKARHLQLQKHVAFKLLRNDRSVESNAVARFQREMRAIGQLDHPNIVRATDAGQYHDSQFLVMELIEGRNLHEIVASRGPLPVHEVGNIIRQAALGLDHAHERGLIHRDIKPSNLMLSNDGTVKILDLGLALLAPSFVSWENADGKGPRSDLTAVGVIAGTIDYMAPEQLTDRHHLDARADIYSLGCTMFFLLTGQTVFRDCSSDLFLRMAAHATHPVPRLTQYRPDIPAAFDEILQRMMAKLPKDRYQSAGEVVRVFETIPNSINAESGHAILANAPLGYAHSQSPVSTMKTAPPVPPPPQPPTSIVTTKPATQRVLSPPTLPSAKRPTTKPGKEIPPVQRPSASNNLGISTKRPRSGPVSMTVIAWIATGALVFLTCLVIIVFMALDRQRGSRTAVPPAHKEARGHET